MKTIVIASDSFKGTLSSLDICHLFKDALKDRKDIKAIYLPLADGGEGSLDAISEAIEGRFIEVEVNDLYFHKIKTHFFVDNDNNAYIETASCDGLTLAKENNDPGLVTTYGLGEQILAAINLGIKNIYIFLGGSASNDGGAGLAAALGTRFYNKENKTFIPTGLTLKDIVRIDNETANERLKGINIAALSDVKSPFYGKEGAAYKFAKQKGADEKEIEELDKGLRHLSNIIKNDLNIDVTNVAGSGAAGGLGGGLYAFANAKLVSGINTILDLIHFDTCIKNADLVISGEGKLDKQTYDGKVIDGVASRCQSFNKPLGIIVGISEISLEDIKKSYPCIKFIYETNDKHLPFEEVKKTAVDDYKTTIGRLLDKELNSY